MHPHVHKRVGIAYFRQLILVLIMFHVIKQSVVFRMLQNHLKRHVFHRAEHFPPLVFAPGLEKELTRLVSRRIEYQGFLLKNILKGFFGRIHTSRLSGTPNILASLLRRCSARAKSASGGHHGGILWGRI